MRARIEINIRKMVIIALQNSVPVYLRKELSGKIVYAHSLVHILPAPISNDPLKQLNIRETGELFQ